MLFASSLNRGVKTELRNYFVPPRQLLFGLVINGIVSLLFFLASYYLGNYSAQLLPVAAATILLWTLADSSITNQLLFDRQRATREYKNKGTLKQLLLAKNLAIVVLSIPLTLIFGLIVALIVGKWSEIIYGMILAFTLIWGWLGISNVFSVLLPFELMDVKSYIANRKAWLTYGLLYGLPWIILPVYALLMGLPFILLGWTKANTVSSHSIVAAIILLLLSLIIWYIGLRVAENYESHPKSRIKRLIS